MPSTSKTKNLFATNAKRQIQSELLVPIMAFLHKSGMSKATLLTECRAAIQVASSSKLKVVHVSIGQDLIGIVNRWLKDPMYLNSSGRPDELPLSGKRSVRSLVGACKAKVSPKEALTLMTTYGVATRVSSGKYRLVRRLMDYGHTKYLPFEPSYRFLVDATKVSTKRLRRTDKRPGIFWQCADNPRIDSRKMGEFMQFAQQRGLSFMHEINDWLDAHDCATKRLTKRRPTMKRIGVGIFGICQ
jgi:hypothetical protein